jgi:Na+/H+ antiporter NhaD/arsenite permease-like protein
MPFAMMDLGVAPPLWILAPFVLLLGAIAMGPLLTPQLWHQRYPIFSVCMAAIVMAYYLIGRRQVDPLVHSLQEYISFMALVGSLYVVAGGIHLGVAGEATPCRNVAFLALGGVLANLLGTTGAAMLLIRPWIRMNRYRITGFHIVFFIFIVANAGGCLTPVGDPPLFLGYLRGVPFFWTLQHLWPDWLLVILLLLAVFYVLDSINFRRAPKSIREKETGVETFRLEGAKNAWFVFIILGAVLLRGAGPPWGVPEVIMGLAAWGSHRLTHPVVREKNDFSFEPLREVAWLFLGIFATLVPVVHTLTVQSGNFGHPSDLQFYFMTGSLSAFLDNAPTYLTFLTLALALHQPPLHLLNPQEVAMFAANDPHTLAAISLGAVFFGACTYIGNGPNLLVKSIADAAKIRVPSFFGYIFRYSLPILLPILALSGWLFIR